tara:strand:- start:111 stop:716 length:606 start_codon:yes stop_codon:yes gene_type:complete
MSIVKLKNPKTKLYTDIKNHILGNSNLGKENFNWTYLKRTTQEFNEENLTEYYYPILKKYHQEDKSIFNTPMYNSVFLARPNRQDLYSIIYSQSFMEYINEMYSEILNANINIMGSFNMMCRCAANAVHPSTLENVITVPHTDHNFPHKNMLIYLTDSGGSTFVEGEEFAPEEDDVIIFEGMHWHELPKEERRVVLVMTYI